MSTFSRDLKRGKKFEEKHLAIIQKTYPDAYMIDGYCKEWDIWIPSINIGIEVKADLMSQSTGNIGIEISYNGKPSALSTTKAKYWIFDTGVDTIYASVDDLKELVSNPKFSSYPFFRPNFIAKGDSLPKAIYFIPQRFIEEINLTIEAILQPETKGQLDKFL
tara:strand:+ start:43 stop:531 length:489 start_codon:yes stop_codon:yes gene_type:complete